MALDQLHTELQALMAAIDNREGELIAAHLRQLDELGQELGSEAPPMLRHYLEKRSYTKALDFLEGRDEAAAPNC
ncbi:MAG: hypothetical protein OXI72_00080 [Gemmatimonadota bacterium]|nr:hypothetical protein [Gemmatimonadota bacterium]